MQIAVTGGTGYLGAYTVRALLAAGNEVRLLTEPGWRNDNLWGQLRDVGQLSMVSGDVRDDKTVSTLLEDCDAVLNAAGVVGTDNRRQSLMWEINAYGAEAILRQAADRGLDPIVSVSSYSALFPPTGPVIGPDTPPVAGRTAYAKTKAYADRVARSLQRQGVPVVITYPSSVVGPAWATPPGITEQGWASILRYGVAPRLHGAGMQMVDVRDVADVHAALMRPRRGPKRYVCGGQMVAFDDMVDLLEQGSGRPIRRIPMSGRLFRALGRVSDTVSAVVPGTAGFSYEAAQLMTAAIPTDDSLTLAELAIKWRSPHAAILETVQDSMAGSTAPNPE